MNNTKQNCLPFSRTLLQLRFLFVESVLLIILVLRSVVMFSDMAWGLVG
jgi:hypothetical protein